MTHRLNINQFGAAKWPHINNFRGPWGSRGGGQVSGKHRRYYLCLWPVFSSYTDAQTQELKRHLESAEVLKRQGHAHRHTNLHCPFPVVSSQNHKNPRAHKNKIGTSTLPFQETSTPPQNEEFDGHGVFPAERIESGVAPANHTKERAKTKSSWISPIFGNSGVFPRENKHDSQIELLFRNALRKVHELTFLWFGLLGPLLIEKCQAPIKLTQPFPGPELLAEKWRTWGSFWQKRGAFPKQGLRPPGPIQGPISLKP